MRFRLVAAAAVLAIVSVCAASSPASSPKRIVRAQAEPEATADVRVRLKRDRRLEQLLRATGGLLSQADLLGSTVAP